MEPAKHIDSSTEPAGPPLGWSAPPDSIPKSFGPFRVLDVVHRSQMSVVYKAVQERPSRTIALKIPIRRRASFKESRQRFVEETQLAAGVVQVGIVPVLEAGEVDGVPYYTMPFIEGRSFADHVKQAKLDLGRRLDLYLRLCHLVQKLHARQLVHLDLKPGNVMVDRAEDVWVLDFGISRNLVDIGAVTEHSIGGTPPYMAPEQTYEDRPRLPSADVHALGVMLYELLTDNSPFPVIGANSEQIFRTIRESQPRPPSACKRDLPDRYDDLVVCCLRKDPRARPQTAGELAAVLEAVRAGGRPSLPLPSPAAPTRNRRWWPVLTTATLVPLLLLTWSLVRKPGSASDWNLISADPRLADVTNLLSLVPAAFPVALDAPAGNRAFLSHEHFHFQARSDRDCYMAVFLHSRDGKTYLLAPDSGGVANPLATRSLDVQSEATAAPPFGLEVAQVIACTSADAYRRLLENFRQGMSHAEFARRLQENRLGVRGVSLPNASSPPVWSSAYLTVHTRASKPVDSQ